ncbi:Like-Sm ribonucleoprotein core [Halobacteriales archaeon SW_5_70_135]|nr:MAG: Like-Sm ribonucleoprotein core [Halobacteriales archaeon SW_5_70_135]
MSGRPLDVLEASLDEEVTVRLKGGTVYEGRLGGYDQHLNLVLERPALVRAGQDGGAGLEEAPDPEADGGTVIIRGDNLVSITT